MEGPKVVQETVLWDVAAGETRPMRSKEEAHDYRYFPEPDLPPLVVEAEWVEQERRRVPDLPAARKRRLVEHYGLSETEAQLLTLEAPLADYYEAVADGSGNRRAAANYILNDLQRAQNAAKRNESEIPLPAPALAELIRLVDAGTISATAARQELFPEIYRTGRSPAELVRERGLEQVSDEAALNELVRAAIEANPQQADQYRAGKRGLLGYLVGQVMRASGGKANPGKVSRLLEQFLEQK